MTRDEEIIAFHYCLGVAITQWSNVEMALSTVVVACFRPADLNREALGVGFFSLEGFRAKLEFADRVVSRKLAASKHLGDWKKLIGKARSFSQQRNKLAHWPIAKYWDETIGRRVVLGPWITKKPKSGSSGKPPKESLRIRDIIRLGNDFLALAVALNNFCARAAGQPEPYAKSREQGDRPMTVATLRRQIREVFSDKAQMEPV